MRKGFFIGIILGIICVFSVVYAADNIAKIKSAGYNDSAVFFNGEKMDLNGKSLISVINEGEDNLTNYMPLRAVLESLGYGVVWGYGSGNGIGIFTEEYLINSAEWVNYREMLDILKIYSRYRGEDLTLYFRYVESAKAVLRAFGYPSPKTFYFSTAVINGDMDKIYIKKSELDHYFANELFGVPPVNMFTKDFIEKLEKFYGEVVTMAELSEIVGKIYNYSGDFNADYLQDWPRKGLRIIYNYLDKQFEVYYDFELQGYIIPAEFAPYYDWGMGMRIKKEDINYYLKKYGMPEIG